MTQIDELKKWLNECFKHYEALLEMKALTPYDRTIWDAYRCVMSRIAEIEQASKNLVLYEVCFHYRSIEAKEKRINNFLGRVFIF